MKNFNYDADATPLDPDEMAGLKLPHITTRGELDRWEQENINEAFNWLGRKRKEEILTESFVKKLHEKMFSKVWTWAGTFRLSGKNIGVDSFQMRTELHKLFEDVRYLIAKNTFDADEIAIRFHHRLVWIHLFPNGNGRHARLMTDLLLKENLHKSAFTWGSNMGSIDIARKAYIKALRKADVGDYLPLIRFSRA